MKYNIYLGLSFLFLLTVVFFICYRISKTKQNLVLIHGILSVSKKISHGARSGTVYFQKMDGFKASFTREFSGLSRFVVSGKIKKIYREPSRAEVPDVYWIKPQLKPMEQRKATLYVFKNDIPKLNQDLKLSYVYVRLNNEPISRFTFYADLLRLVLKKQMGVFIILILVFANIGLLIMAGSGSENPYERWMIRYSLFVVGFYILLFLY